MKKINWNTASELGLIERINKEVLHPLGLAMVRTPDDGRSPFILVAPDKEFTYSFDLQLKPILSTEEIHAAIDKVESL